jgi:MFS family permease
MISVFFGGVTALLPIFASEIIPVGPKGLGLLRAAPAIGAALTGFWLTRTDIRAHAGKWLFTAVSGFGLGILAFGLSRSFPLSLFALAVSGAFDSISMVVRSTAVQLASPEKMRGRISAVNSIFIGSSNELGEFESGIAARFLGTVPAVLAGAGICLFTVAGAYALSPALRTLHLGRLEEARKDPG